MGRCGRDRYPIRVWFVCGSCGYTFNFRNIDEILHHKELNHFQEFQNTRCIVFEEKRNEAISNFNTDSTSYPLSVPCKSGRNESPLFLNTEPRSVYSSSSSDVLDLDHESCNTRSRSHNNIANFVTHRNGKSFKKKEYQILPVPDTTQSSSSTVIRIRRVKSPIPQNSCERFDPKSSTLDPLVLVKRLSTKKLKTAKNYGSFRQIMNREAMPSDSSSEKPLLAIKNRKTKEKLKMKVNKIQINPTVAWNLNNHNTQNAAAMTQPNVIHNQHSAPITIFRPQYCVQGITATHTLNSDFPTQTQCSPVNSVFNTPSSVEWNLESLPTPESPHQLFLEPRNKNQNQLDIHSQSPLGMEGQITDDYASDFDLSMIPSNDSRKEDQIHNQNLPQQANLADVVTDAEANILLDIERILFSDLNTDIQLPTQIPIPTTTPIVEHNGQQILTNDNLISCNNLRDWLLSQRTISNINGDTHMTNIILLDPDPTVYSLGPITHLNNIQCKLCCKILTSDEDTKNHVKICWRDNKDRHRYCVLCKKTFSNPSSLQKHYVRMHVTREERARQYKFKCERCFKSFKQEYQLKEHTQLYCVHASLAQSLQNSL